MAAKPRNYTKEYQAYQGTPEQIKKRAQRNKARRDYEKAKGPLSSGTDVDHVKPLSKGGTSKLSNLRAVPKSKNRSFARTSSSKMK